MNRAVVILAASIFALLGACSRDSGDPPPAPGDGSASSAPSATPQGRSAPSPSDAGADPKRNRPGEPGFDPTKPAWPPLVPALPEAPGTLIIRIDRATQHGLHTTIDLTILGPRDEIGDFSFSLLFKDANNRGLSLQRVIVPRGASTREFTLMGVQADKIATIEADLHDAMTPDGYFLDQLPKRYNIAVEDKR